MPRRTRSRSCARKWGRGPIRGVIHCFTASGDFADKALELGLYISISGIVTFKNAKDLQETAARLPLDRLLIETDAPFLAPVPNRGKTGRAGLRRRHCRVPGASCAARMLEELAETTRANFFTLFAKTSGMKVRILGCGHIVGRAADRQ